MHACSIINVRMRLILAGELYSYSANISTSNAKTCLTITEIYSNQTQLCTSNILIAALFCVSE